MSVLARCDTVIGGVRGLVFVLLILVIQVAAADIELSAPEFRTWNSYNGQSSGEHYSALDQINRSSAGLLQQAWIFNIGETDARFECNPLIVERTLYGFTPALKVIALDAARGTLKWKFDSGVRGAGPIRGLSYWTNRKERRLFAGIMQYLYALDPRTGRPITSFGQHGRIDLRKNLRGDSEQHFVQLTSPGVVFENLIIVGFRTGETSPAPPGDIRAYDVRSGRLRWRFHTVPHPGEFGSNTWPIGAWRTAGAANNWAGMAIDQKRGIVYAPTGSAVSDFYGADRVGDNLFADTLLALDARTGRRLWHFQGVHHDLWDRDFSSPPALVTVRDGESNIEAVAQPTKQGFLFLFDRRTGAALFPIEEKAYPASDVPGEVTAATQPTPVKPAPFARQRLTADLVTTRTPEAHSSAIEQFETFISGGQFVPLRLDRQTVVFPGFDGGAEWGGPAVDPSRGILYINSNDIAWTGGLARIEQSADPTEALYERQCISCHGPARMGSPPAFPSLVDIDQRRSIEQLLTTIRQGKGRMPAFAGLGTDQLRLLIRYISHGGTPIGSSEPRPEVAPNPPAMMRQMLTSKGIVAFTGYHKFLDLDGYPAVVPPWGTLSAIDLNTGNYLWQIPLGEYPALAAQGVPITGTENYGGPVVTAGGIVIIAATVYDRKIRIVDASNGELLWQSTLPFAGTATPATYQVDGKQFIVIATSGARDAKAAQGSAYIAFSLPE